jgi:ATP-binding protein involved in chromosome partitioning
MCPHCHDRIDVFSYGGGRKTAEMMNVDFLGELPLNPAIRIGGDSGKPVALEDAPEFAAIAQEVERRSAAVSSEKRPKIEIED